MLGEPHPLPIGKGELVREGTDLTIAALGSSVLPATRAAEILAEGGISAEVINARFVKPLDDALILKSVGKTGALVTVEEAMLAGGFGSAVLELLAREEIERPVDRLGLADKFYDHASQNALRRQAGIDAESIAKRAAALIGTKTTVATTVR
jgi:1-deoxy-D-xylulose-5-phosphate synthase